MTANSSTTHPSGHRSPPPSEMWQMKYELPEQSWREVTYIWAIMSFRKTPSSNSEKSKCLPPSCGTNVLTWVRKTWWEAWYLSVWQEMRASRITHPSDKWAQHELIQTRQKNSTLHGHRGCGWSVRAEYPSCFEGDQAGSDPVTTCSCRRAPLSSSHPSRSQLVEMSSCHCGLDARWFPLTGLLPQQLHPQHPPV